jgi:hypothetical protein
MKSPWIILVMGLLACGVLALMSQYYVRQSPVVRISEGLKKDLGLQDAQIEREAGGYRVTYSCDARLRDNPRALKRNMTEVAEYVRSRLAVERVRVIAEIEGGEPEELIYPPEQPQAAPFTNIPEESSRDFPRPAPEAPPEQP